MNYDSLFSETTKMVDLVRANCRLLDVLPRFGIGLSFKARTVHQVCEEKGISAQTLLLVCNVYTFNGYRPYGQMLETVPVTELLDFFAASHRDYREVSIPKLFTRVNELREKNILERHHNILFNMVRKYRALVLKHVGDEELSEFPYFMALLNGKKSSGEGLLHKTEDNEELRVLLRDIQSIITMYLSDSSVDSLLMYRDMLSDIDAIDYDTSKHVLLEDILAARIERIAGSAI